MCIHRRERRPAAHGTDPVLGLVERVGAQEGDRIGAVIFARRLDPVADRAELEGAGLQHILAPAEACVVIQSVWITLKAIHRKAMPVILTTEEERDA